jgi:mannosyl-oligosaccharide alpha-1,2-mannosidase
MVMRPENGVQDYVILGHVDSASKTIEPNMEHLVRSCFLGVVLPFHLQVMG